MGWASGTGVCIDAWSGMRDCVPFNHRAAALYHFIIALQAHDWDCEYEIEDEWPEAEEALRLAETYWEERKAGPVRVSRLTERERKILYEGKWS